VAAVVEKPFHKYRDIPLKKHVEDGLKARERRRDDPGEKMRRRRLSKALREFEEQSRARAGVFHARLEKSRGQADFDRKEEARRLAFRDQEDAARAAVYALHAKTTVISSGS
jgi:hypothetical protein